MATDASRFKAALFKNAASFFVSDQGLCVTRSGVFHIMEEFEEGCERAVESCLVDHELQGTDAYSYFVFYSIFVDKPYVLEKRYELDIYWLHEICWEAHDKHRVQPGLVSPSVTTCPAHLLYAHGLQPEAHGLQPDG